MIVVFGSINLDLVARVEKHPQPGETVVLVRTSFTTAEVAPYWHRVRYVAPYYEIGTAWLGSATVHPSPSLGALPASAGQYFPIASRIVSR